MGWGLTSRALAPAPRLQKGLTPGPRCRAGLVGPSGLGLQDEAQRAGGARSEPEPWARVCPHAAGNCCAGRFPGMSRGFHPDVWCQLAGLAVRMCTRGRDWSLRST